MTPGGFWPSWRVLGYRRTAPRTVAVQFERGRLWWRRSFELELRCASTGWWFWDRSGVQLTHAPAHVWAALHEAAGVPPCTSPS